jgi:4-oxalomesaconate hydratase
MARTALVVSAHSADFVWRCGGAIALHAEKGFEVTVICLSYGERGESAKLWRVPGMTLERVKQAREAEARKAATALGVHDIQFWDLGDYPITLTNDSLFRLVDVYRAIHPEFVLTHSKEDIYNRDHPAVTDFAQHARITAQAHGHNPGQKVLGAPPVFLFECMEGQEHLWEYYTRVAQQRGAQAARNSDKKIVWGEGFQSVFPHVVETLA